MRVTIILAVTGGSSHCCTQATAAVVAGSPAVAAVADTTRVAGRKQAAAEQHAYAPPSKRQKVTLSSPAKSTVDSHLATPATGCHPGPKAAAGLDNASDQADTNLCPPLLAKQVDLQHAEVHALVTQPSTDAGVPASLHAQEQQAAAAACNTAPVGQDRYTSRSGPFAWQLDQGTSKVMIEFDYNTVVQQHEGEIKHALESVAHEMRMLQAMLHISRHMSLTPGSPTFQVSHAS